MRKLQSAIYAWSFSLGRASRGTLLVLVSAVSFGLIPIFARLAYSQGVGVRELLFVRFLLAFLIMGTILAASRRLIVPNKDDLLILIALGALAYFLQSTLYFTALLYSPVAIVALLLYTYPVFVTIGAFVLGWEKISRRLAGAFVIATLGLILAANPFGNTIGFGVILALGASITYTIYILGGSKVLRRIKGDVAAFYVLGAGSISFGLTGALTGSIHLNWTPEGWFWVAMLTVICAVVAISTFFMGLSRIGPSRASLLSLVEPVTSVLVSLWLFGNALNALQWFGGLLILVATALTALYGNPEPRADAGGFT
ncbi:MAG TPA: DMT family transporter [Candidatus Dormibacteraeota bacterium]|nr:DMT family transporter [Candidatus Dormibacteraeota bacterium]